VGDDTFFPLECGGKRPVPRISLPLINHDYRHFLLLVNQTQTLLIFFPPACMF
jgi:hypothetical protein